MLKDGYELGMGLCRNNDGTTSLLKKVALKVSSTTLLMLGAYTLSCWEHMLITIALVNDDN